MNAPSPRTRTAPIGVPSPAVSGAARAGAVGSGPPHGEVAGHSRPGPTRASATAWQAPKSARARSATIGRIFSAEPAALIASAARVSSWSCAARSRSRAACRRISSVFRKSSTNTDTLARSTSGTTGVRM